MEIHWATMLRAQLIGENAVKLGIKDAEIILFFVLFDKRICSLERKVLLYLFTSVRKYRSEDRRNILLLSRNRLGVARILFKNLIVAIESNFEAWNFLLYREDLWIRMFDRKIYWPFFWKFLIENIPISIWPRGRKIVPYICINPASKISSE